MASRLLSLAGLLRTHWRVPFGLAILAGGSVLLMHGSEQFDIVQQAVAWVVLVVVVMLLLRQALEALVGPVLVFDLIRTARRSRYALLRSLYAALLLAVLFLVYTNEFGRDLVGGLAGIMDEQTLPPSQMAQFAGSFFHMFLIVQFIVIVLLAPAFTAGAIAEEKEKGTLHDLLTTHLTGREIVLGKLVSRVSHLILLLLAGVPILSLLQLLGGVDPSLLAAGFGLTLTTAIGVGSVALLCSVHASKPRDAVFLTYVLIVGYQFVSSFYGGVFLVGHKLGSMPEFVLGTLNAGNLIAAYLQLTQLSEQGALPESLPLLLLQYLTFHGTLAFICVSVAVAQLRGKAIRVEKPTRFSLPPGVPEGAIPARVFLERKKQLMHPRLGNNPPMMWKERYIERGIELHPLGQQILSMITVIVLAMACTVFACGLVGTAFGGRMPDFANHWLKVCVPVVAGVGMFGLALRAAGTITGERERQTFDSLLTSDLRNKDIILGKLAGCIWGMKKVAIVLAAMLGAGMLTGGVLPPFVPLLVLALAAHAAFAVSLGMYCSLVSRTTLRATVATVCVMLAITLGHWLVLLVVTTVCHLFGIPGVASGLADFHAHGLTPPMTLLAFLVPLRDQSVPEVNRDMARWTTDAALAPVPAAVIGILFYTALAVVLWTLLQARFGKVTGRLR